MLALAHRHLAARALHAAHQHLRHVAAVPVPGFLGFRVYTTGNNDSVWWKGGEKQMAMSHCWLHRQDADFLLILEDNAAEAPSGRSRAYNPTCTNLMSDFNFGWFYIGSAFCRLALPLCLIFVFEHMKHSKFHISQP